MTELLSKSVHSIKKGDSLQMYNALFPYPPFCTYKYDMPSSVEKTYETLFEATGEGGTSRYIEIFTFTESGEFDLEINLMQYGKGNDDVVDKTYKVKVLVSE